MDTDQRPTPRKRSRRGPHCIRDGCGRTQSKGNTPLHSRVSIALTTSSRGWSPCVVQLDRGPGAPRLGPRLSGSLTPGLSTSWFAAS
jgi:hypothetical protein